MRIAVFGAGGIGGYFGARLAQAGNDVALVARGAHLQAIQANGLFVKSSTGDFHITPFIATNSPAEVGVVDLVILGTKAWDVRAASEQIRPMIGPDTGVLTLQNGVEAPTEVADVLGDDHVIVGVSPVRCFIETPGRLKHVGGIDPQLTLGEIDNRASKRVDSIHAAFSSIQVSVQIPDDIHSWLWLKFAGAATLGGIGTLTRVSTGVWRTIPEVRKFFQDSIQEVAAVAAANGVSLPPDGIDMIHRGIDMLPKDHMTSMQEEIIKCKPSELEYWNGAVVRLGKEAGVATPLNEVIYYSLLPQEDQARILDLRKNLIKPPFIL